MNTVPRFTAIILAGGVSKRFGSSIPKPFMSLNGKPVIQYSIDVLEPLVDELIIVSNTQYKDYKCIKAGRTRSESAYNGTQEARGEFVIIHDGARPFLRSDTIIDMKSGLETGIPFIDTASPIIDGYIEDGKCVDKEGKLLGLTPEGFDKKILLEAFERTDDRNWQDEVTMVQKVLGLESDYTYVEGEVFNSKLTFEQDLAYAEGIMKFWSKPITTKPDLSKKTLVFGGSSGIGKACTEALANCTAPTRKQIDLSKDWEIELSPYEAIIYSAGEYADEEKIMKVNFDSFVYLVKQAEQQDWKGNIVALSSTAATYGRKGIPVYSASKSALNAYIEARHGELAEKGIYINAIAPAKVDTRLQETINPSTPKSEMLTVEYVADYVLRYIDTKVSGHIIYLRKGFDK